MLSRPFLQFTKGPDDELVRILFALVGLVAGLLTYVLTLVPQGETLEPWLISGAFFISAFSNFFFLSFDKDRPGAALLVSTGIALLLASFLWFRLEATKGNDEFENVVHFFALYWIIPQIALPLFISGTTQGWKHPDYELLHRKAWNLPLIWMGAGLLVGMVTLVLVLWAMLFKIIHVDFFADLFVERWFYLPVLGAVSGLGVAIMREREKTVASLRDLFQNLFRVVLPLLAVLYVIFVPIFLILNIGFLNPAKDMFIHKGAVPFSYIMMFFLLIGVFTLNTALAYNDDSAIKARALRLAAKAVVLFLPFLCVFPAVYLFGVTSRFGLTPDRLLGLVVLYLLAGYAFSYFLAGKVWRKSNEGWMERVRRTNIPMAYIVFVVALWLASPVGNVQHIAAYSQVDRLLSGHVAAEKFDFKALKFDFGKPGKDALVYLGAHIDNHPEQALIREKLADVAKMDTRYAPDTVKASYTFVPEGGKFPEGVEEDRFRYQCGEDKKGCRVLLLQPDMFVVVTPNPDFIFVYRQDDGKWFQRMKYRSWKPEEKKAVLDNLDKARLIDRSYKALQIGNTIIDPFDDR